MKKDKTTPPPPPPPPPKPQQIIIPKTHSQISQQYISNIEKQFTQKLQIGKISINEVRTYVQLPKVQQADGPQSIQQNLKLLKNNIVEQKKLQRQEERQRLMKAQEFITKMKKQKSSYENQLKQKQQAHRDIIHQKIFSQSIINKMRERLEGKIIQKRQEIESRIKSIELRKKQREEQNLEQQITYWQKLKQVGRKQSKSSIKLPSIFKSQSLQLPRLPRKNSLQHLQSIQIITKPAAYDSQRSERYDDIINKKLKKVKTQKQRLTKINPQASSDGLMANGTLITQPNAKESQQLKNSKLHINKDFLPYSVDKFKLFGNQYLKESLLIIKKPNNAAQNHNESAFDEKDLEINTNLAHINKNLKVEKLQQKWERVLSKIQNKEVQIEQGLQLINSIQKRLDKLDFQNISVRLKKKCHIFEQIKDDKGLRQSIQIK